MNTKAVTKGLRKNYHTLTPEERVKLIFAAEERGDKEERRALMDTAPRITFDVKHHYGLSQALLDVEESVLVGLLSLSVQLMCCWYYLLDKELCDSENGEAKEKLNRLVGHLSAEYLASQRAWSAIAEEYGIGEGTSLSLMRQRLPFLDLALGLVEEMIKLETERAGLEYDYEDLVATFREHISEKRKEWE